MHMNDLPTELLLEIFTYLPQSNIITTLKFVSKKWKELASSPILWRNLNLYNDGYFLSLGNERLCHMLQNTANSVYNLRTRTTCVYTKFQPEIFTGLKALHLRMYDDDQCETIQKIINCYCNLETFKLDVTKFDRLTEVISTCKTLTKLKCFHLRHFFCNHSSNLKLMPHVFQVLFKSTSILTSVTVSCGDIFLDIAIQSLLDSNRDLVELNLSRCTGITNVAFLRLQRCNVRLLNLNRTSIDDEALKKIADNCPYLRMLSIVNCKNVTDKGLNFIAQKSEMLQDLLINDYTSSGSCQVTNTGLQYISEGCRDLRSLVANCHPHIDASILTPIGILCTNLRILKMQQVANINDSSLMLLAKYCKLLERVDLNDCPGITGNGVSHVIVGCRWFKSGNFSSCFNISNMCLDTLAGPGFSLKMKTSDTFNESSTHIDSKFNHHSHVTNLNFIYCDEISAQSLVQLSTFCPDLNDLRIPGWTIENIDIAIIQLIQNCRNLHTLICFARKGSEETNLTNKSLDAMAEHGKNLTKLHLSLNLFITMDSLGKVLVMCPKLEQVDLYINDTTALSLKDIENFITSCDSKKMACQSYNRSSSVGCIIRLNEQCIDLR